MNATYFTAAMLDQDVTSEVPSNSTTALHTIFCDSSCSYLSVFIVSTMLSVCAILANATIVATIALSSTLRGGGDSMLMVDLCLSNMLSAVAVGSFSTCAAQTQLLYSLPACILTAVAQNTATAVAFVTIAAMAFDRYLAVAYHLRYASLATPAKYAIFIVAQWLLCTLVNALPLFNDGTVWCVRRFGGCSYDAGGPAIYVTIIVLYLPCVVAIIFAYARIWAVIRKMPITAGSEVTERQQRTRGLRTTVIILSAYAVTTLPRAVKALFSEQKSAVLLAIEDASALFLNSNALLSPIIYGLTNRAIKDRLASFIHQLCNSNAKVEPFPRSTNETVSRR